MERTLRLIDAQLEVADIEVTPPCDGHGRELTSRRGRGQGLAGGCWSRCCSSWRRWRPRGAATRPLAGTASRPRRPAGPTRSGSTRPGRQGWRRPRPRSTWRPSSPGRTPTSAARRRSPTSTSPASVPSSRPAFDAWIATHPLDEPGRAAHAVRHGRVPGAARGRRRPGWTPRPRPRRPRSALNIQRVEQLRAHRRALRGGALLRRHQHQDRQPPPALAAGLAGCAVLVGAIAWIATFPVSWKV